MIKRVSLTFRSFEGVDETGAHGKNESLWGSLTDSLTWDPEIRLSAPAVWERSTTGYRIVDLRHEHKNSALALINSHFFTEEPVCSATLLSKDPVSVKYYQRFVERTIFQGKSICAVEEGKGRLVGVAIVSIRPKNDEKNHTEQAEALSVMTDLEKYLFTKTDLEKTLDGDEKYFRIDALCVHPEHREKGVATGLLRSCIEKTRFFNMQFCIGVFSSSAAQRIARRLGFQTLGEVFYSTYFLESSQDNPFDNIGPENHTLACMLIKIIPEYSIPQNSTSMDKSKKN